MSNQDNGDNSNSESNAVNRRHMLLGGTTLAAASALGTAASVQKPSHRNCYHHVRQDTEPRQTRHRRHDVH
jgi:hypothetical protein